MKGMLKTRPIFLRSPSKEVYLLHKVGWSNVIAIRCYILRIEVIGEVFLGHTSPNCIASNEPTQAHLLPRLSPRRSHASYTDRAKGAREDRA